MVLIQMHEVQKSKHLTVDMSIIYFDDQSNSLGRPTEAPVDILL